MTKEEESALAWADSAVIDPDLCPFENVRYERNQAKTLAQLVRRQQKRLEAAEGVVSAARNPNLHGCCECTEPDGMDELRKALAAHDEARKGA
jgi:hypothetical protein